MRRFKTHRSTDHNAKHCHLLTDVEVIDESFSYYSLSYDSYIFDSYLPISSGPAVLMLRGVL
jgi:hypothetical protein